MRFAEYFGIKWKGAWYLRGGQRRRQEDQEGGCHSNAGRILGEPKCLGIGTGGGVQKLLGGTITEHGVQWREGREAPGMVPKFPNQTAGWK